MSLRMRKNKKEKTMFYEPPAHSDIAGVITIGSPRTASVSIETLNNMHRDARHDKRVQIEKSMVLAANRAEASVSRSRLSAKEQEEMRKVASQYRSAATKLRERREREETKPKEPTPEQKWNKRKGSGRPFKWNTGAPDMIRVWSDKKRDYDYFEFDDVFTSQKSAKSHADMLRKEYGCKVRVNKRVGVVSGTEYIVYREVK